MTSPLPFLPRQKQALADVGQGDTTNELEQNLGDVFRVGPKAWRLVQSAGTNASVGGKAFEYSSQLNWTVNLADAATDRVAGVADLNLPDLVADDYLLLQILGEFEGIANEAITAPRFGIPSTTGKIGDGGALGDRTPEVDFCVVLDDAAADGDQVTCRIIQELGN